MPTQNSFVNRPVFVLGERAAAVQLIEALGRTAALCAVPLNRLLFDLVVAVNRGSRSFVAADAPLDGFRPGAWYGDVHAALARAAGKPRTIEFSGLSVISLCEMFPAAQFVVVRQLKRAMPRSRRLPPLERGRILEIDSEAVDTAETLELVLAFLGEPAGAVVLDLSDGPLVTPA